MITKNLASSYQCENEAMAGLASHYSSIYLSVIQLKTIDISPFVKLSIMASLFLFAFIQLGCGNAGGICVDNPPCPPGKHRDFLCGCSDNLDSPTPPPNNSAPDALLFVDCVCALPDNKLTLWTRSRLQNYDSIVGKTIRVSIPTTSQGSPINKDDRVCPYNGKIEIKIKQPLSIRVEDITKMENLWGGQVFSLTGTPLSKVDRIIYNDRSSKVSPVPQPRFPSQPLVNSLHVSFFQTPNNLDSCLKCPPYINAKCMSGEIDSEYQRAIGQMMNLSSAGEKVITSTDLLKSFRLGSDPCHRGPTGISLFGVSNIGEPCSLGTKVGEFDLRIFVDIPARLEGKWSTRSLSQMKIVFDKTEYAPSLKFLKLESNDYAELHEQYGGKVEFAEADKQRFFLKTKGGCVGIQTTNR